MHVLCYGITPEDHEWLQAHNDSVEECAEYLHAQRDHGRAGAPVLRGRGAADRAPPPPPGAAVPDLGDAQRLAGQGANLPAFVYIETHGGTAIGGSDDHAGIDIGRTFTETRGAHPVEFLAHIRAGDAVAHGDQGGAAKWTHAAMALAIRSLGRRRGRRPARPRRGPEDRRARDERGRRPLRSAARPRARGRARAAARLARGDGARGRRAQADRACCRTATSATRTSTAARAGSTSASSRGAVDETVAVIEEGGCSTSPARRELFDACIPAIPYAAAGRLPRAREAQADPQRRRPPAGGAGRRRARRHARRDPHDPADPRARGPRLRGRGDRHRRRRRPAAERGRRGRRALLQRPQDRGPEHPRDRSRRSRRAGTTWCTSAAPVRRASPPGGSPGCSSCRCSAATTPSSPPTRVCAPARPPGELADFALGRFYGACDVVLSPSSASDERLEEIGVEPSIIGRWDRGVDLKRFDPELRDETLLPDGIRVLYAGRLTKEKGVDLLADAFLAARARDPRLHLVLAGGGPEEERSARPAR